MLTSTYTFKQSEDVEALKDAAVEELGGDTANIAYQVQISSLCSDIAGSSEPLDGSFWNSSGNRILYPSLMYVCHFSADFTTKNRQNISKSAHFS